MLTAVNTNCARISQQPKCDQHGQAGRGMQATDWGAHVLFTGTMAVLEGLTRIGKLPSMLPPLRNACKDLGGSQTVVAGSGRQGGCTISRVAGPDCLPRKLERV